jgi:hypothetical protein
MPAPIKTPVKSPASTPVPDPERWVRTICPEQTRRHMFPGPIFPAK